jgi:hypothetical protein
METSGMDIRCPIPPSERRGQDGHHWLKGYDWLAEEKASLAWSRRIAEVIPLADHRPKTGEKQ